MIVFIGGSRSITEYGFAAPIVMGIIFRHFRPGEIKEVISGGAKGMDTLAEQVARSHRMPFEAIKADWDHCAPECPPDHRRTSFKSERSYCPTAGHRRNQRCADMIDAYIGLWDGKSTGTLDMLHRCLDRKVLVYFETIR